MQTLRDLTVDWLRQHGFDGLKPCPFCGGEGDLHWGEPGNLRYWVACTDLKCIAIVEKAIAAWNQRSGDDAEVPS